MVQYASKVAQTCRSTSLARSATKVNKISFNERSSLFGQRCDRVDLQMLASNFFRYRTSDAFCVFAERTKNAVAASSNAIDTFGNFLVSEKSNKSARPIPATGREMSYIERVSFIEIYWSLVSLAHFMNFTVIRINTL